MRGSVRFKDVSAPTPPPAVFKDLRWQEEEKSALKTKQNKQKNGFGPRRFWCLAPQGFGVLHHQGFGVLHHQGFGVLHHQDSRLWCLAPSRFKALASCTMKALVSCTIKALVSCTIKALVSCTSSVRCNSRSRSGGRFPVSVTAHVLCISSCLVPAQVQISL